MHLKYSVIIAAYRRPTLLCKTLEHLMPQVGFDGEVIVVEQCPLTDIRSKLSGYTRLRHIILEKPGAVEARNQGIRISAGEILVFIDDDVVPPPGFLMAHLHGYVDPLIGGVSGRVIEAMRMTSSEFDERSLDPVDGWRWTTFDHARELDVPHAPTCNLSLRRSAVFQVGGFDPAFRLAWREDSDLCFRVRQLGYRIRFSPAAWLTHLSAKEGGTREASSAGLVGKEVQLYGKHYLHYHDNLYFLLKHFHGRQLLRWVLDAYRTYVGVSRWPWRMAAKNAAFFIALWQAATMVRRRKNRPCSLN